MTTYVLVISEVNEQGSTVFYTVETVSNKTKAEVSEMIDEVTDLLEIE